MSAFDIEAARRWARSFPIATLARRSDDQLPFARENQVGGQALLLDTCVYIDQLQGKAPDLVEKLVDSRQTNHSTIAIQELTHTVGVLDPSDPRTKGVVRVIQDQIEAMPAHRIFTPDADVLGRAGLLNGALCRLQGYTGGQKLRALQDCTLFLQAHKLGFTVLTANISDFDYLLQLVPSGRVLMYRV